MILLFQNDILVKKTLKFSESALIIKDIAVLGRCPRFKSSVKSSLPKGSANKIVPLSISHGPVLVGVMSEPGRVSLL